MADSVDDGAVIPSPAVEGLPEATRPLHAVPQPQEGRRRAGQGRHVSVAARRGRTIASSCRDPTVNTERLWMVALDVTSALANSPGQDGQSEASAFAGGFHPLKVVIE